MENINKFILWLDKYMKDNDSVDTYTWLYKENSNKEDLKFVKIIDEFYLQIENYANMNHMYAKSCDYGEYFNVMINNIGYEIGYDVIQGTLFYIKKTNEEDLSNYININNVINKVIKPGVNNINDRLNNLSNSMINMYEDGVPLESIIRAVDKTICSLEKDDRKGISRTHKIDY